MNIIVTGAGKGIGYSIVKKLSQNISHSVIAISRNIENIKKIKSNNIIPFSFDINTLSSKKLKIDFLKNNKIDILINNAGLLINKPFKDFSRNEISQIMDTNFISTALLIQYLFPFFNEKGTHVINIGSMGGYQGSEKFPGLSFYSASKAALANLTECLAQEFADTKHKFNCLALGAVQTEMLNTAFPGYNAPIMPDEMADYIIDFAINAKKIINGKIIPVSLTTP